MKSIYLEPIIEDIKKEYSFLFDKDIAALLVSTIEKIINIVETESRNHAILTLKRTLDGMSSESKIDSVEARKLLVFSYSRRYDN